LGQRNEEQRADRLVEIMEASVKLFAKKGYHATSISDISEAVGLGRGALYYYITSKEDLLWEIHNWRVDPLLEATIQLEQQPLTPEEKLRAVSRQLIETITMYLPYMIVFYREMGALSPERFAKLVEKRRAYEDSIERILREGVRRGDWEIENPRMCVLAFLGMYNWTFQWYNPQGPMKPDEIADNFFQLFLNGIKRRDH
jgi:TetR/AcrR family transcriptional regulator, cholesterol catabolism regulator